MKATIEVRDLFDLQVLKVALDHYLKGAVARINQTALAYRILGQNDLFEEAERTRLTCIDARDHFNRQLRDAQARLLAEQEVKAV